MEQTTGDGRAPRSGDPLGKILIPRIGLSAMISEGIDNRTLRHAVGHVPGTALPGGSGTVALAGHRDTFFRGLAQIRVNDVVVLETPQATYKYEVVNTAVVGPEQVEVLQPSSGADLTLVTCFPFYYLGPAPQRFVVQTRRIPAREPGA